MLNILKTLLGLVPGGGALGAVSNIATLAAVVAAIAGPAAAIFHAREEVFIQITVGDLAFWGPLMGGVLWLALVVARRAPAP